MADIKYDFPCEGTRNHFPSLRSLKEEMLAAADRVKAKIIERDTVCTELKIELFSHILGEQSKLIARSNKTTRKLCQENLEMKRNQRLQKKKLPKPANQK